MSHKIRVTHQLLRSKSRWLLPFDIVRGEEGTLRVVLTNISEADFPGAAFENLRISWNVEAAGSAIVSSWTMDPCPRLPPGQSHSVEIPFTALANGPAWFKLKFQPASDSQLVQYYRQDSDRPETEDLWLLNVVDTYVHNLLLLVEELVAETKKLTEVPPEKRPT